MGGEEVPPGGMGQGREGGQEKVICQWACEEVKGEEGQREKQAKD